MPLLSINTFAGHDLFCAVADVVHVPDPCHLVIGFEILGDALALGHLADQKVKHGVGLFVDLGEVGAQLAFSGQLRIDMTLGAFQEGCVSPTKAANDGVVAHLCAGICSRYVWSCPSQCCAYGSVYSR